MYFHSAKVGHKIDAIRRCDKVSMCVVECDEVVPEKMTTYFRSAILFGRARVLETDEEIIHAATALAMKYNADQKTLDEEIRRFWDALCCVEIVIEHVTGKEAIELTHARKQ